MDQISFQLFHTIFPSGTWRSFNSMFGVNHYQMDVIFQEYFEDSIFSRIHVFWIFSFLKLYDTYDVLHTLWKVSYNTYYYKIKEMIDFMDQSFNTISADDRTRTVIQWIHDGVQYYICGIIDATECEILKPQNNQERYYLFSGYWGTTSLKYNVICDISGIKIIHVDGPYRGPEHEVTMFRNRTFLNQMEEQVVFFFKN
jgi:hypothetical protein